MLEIKQPRVFHILGYTIFYSQKEIEMLEKSDKEEDKEILNMLLKCEVK